MSGKRKTIHISVHESTHEGELPSPKKKRVTAEEKMLSSDASIALLFLAHDGIVQPRIWMEWKQPGVPRGGKAEKT